MEGMTRPSASAPRCTKNLMARSFCNTMYDGAVEGISPGPGWHHPSVSPGRAKMTDGRDGLDQALEYGLHVSVSPRSNLPLFVDAGRTVVVPGSLAVMLPGFDDASPQG